jgi:DNA-binding MarR family transcriptional regulator
MAAVLSGMQHLPYSNSRSGAAAPQVVGPGRGRLVGPRAGWPTRRRRRPGEGGGVTTSSEEHVLLALARMAMDASVRASGELGGLSPVQLRALTVLRQLGVAKLAQLAEEMGVTVSTTSRLVDRLVGADWVHRTPSPHNRREISLTLTVAGKRLLRRYDTRRVELLKECLERVPGDRQKAVLDALAELVQVSHA